MKEEELLQFFKSCVEEAEKRYEITGIMGYKIIAERIREKIKEFEQDIK